MHWKSYAAVSGATVLAGWLASAPPSNAPAAVQAPAAQRQPPADAHAPTDIEMQAMRLQARLRAERAYAEPGRDPFRFAPRRRPAAVEREQADDAAPALVADAVPPAPMVSLSGIAEDLVDGRTQRTAVLSSPAGVLLVREGEQILGYYRVGRIEADAVELISLGDGTVSRLSLK
jgi:hypothetical protein